jgi:hypothetical protein
MTNKKKFKSWIGRYKPRKDFSQRPKSRQLNQFDVSFGNIKVLRLIPDMMNDPDFRIKLRMLALEFMTSKGIR